MQSVVLFSHSSRITKQYNIIALFGFLFFYKAPCPPLNTSVWMSSYRMLWDLRLISLQQRFISPVWCGPPPLSLRHSVPSSCPSPSAVDWHGTQWHPGHEGRPAAKHREERVSSAPVSITVHYGLTHINTQSSHQPNQTHGHSDTIFKYPLSLCEKGTQQPISIKCRGYCTTQKAAVWSTGRLNTWVLYNPIRLYLLKWMLCFHLRIIMTD